MTSRSENPLHVHCANPDCQAELKVSPDKQGRKVRCPKCQLVFTVSTLSTGPLVLKVQGESTSERRRMHVPAWVDWITQPRPRVRTALRYTIFVSLALHLTTMPLIPEGSISPEQMKNLETEYGKKINAAKSASYVARKLDRRETMPPPPPDPEALVAEVLNKNVSDDIEKVVQKMLGAQVTTRIVSRVSSSLKDELTALSKDIAKGKYDEKQIEEIRNKYRKEAHERAAIELKEYRKDTQVERAALSTTDWYEENVAKVLFNNLRYQMFELLNGRLRWGPIYGSRMGDLVAEAEQPASVFNNRIGLIGNMIDGKRFYDDKPNVSWPGPNREQARFLAERIKELYEGTQKNYAHNYGGGQSWEYLCGAYVRMFQPQRENEMQDCLRKMDDLWKKSLTQAEAYLQRGESGESSSNMQAAQSACLESLREIIKLAPGLKPPHGGNFTGVNRALRSEVLRAQAESGYKQWVDGMVKGLEPIIRKFAEGQFKKGIIVNKDGVDEAKKDFTSSLVTLLRRDVEKLIPRPQFDILIFAPHTNKSKITGAAGPPDKDDIKAEQNLLAKWPDAAYLEFRRQVIAKRFPQVLDELTADLLRAVKTEGLLLRSMDYEGVDYSDKVQEKMSAVEMALAGRGQNLTDLTPDGVPDTSAAQYTLQWGASKGQGASLQPVQAPIQAGYLTRGQPASALRSSAPKLPPPPAKWGFEEQASVTPVFKTPSPCCEGIPFLAKPPRLDGALSDWGAVRPLALKGPRGQQPILVYAGWNYQGFFFGYEIKQPDEKFYYPSLYAISWDNRAATRSAATVRAAGINWAYAGDYFKLCFDTLDARNKNRGEPHSQEFVIFPRGTDNDPCMAGIERVIESQRDATTKQYRGVKSVCNFFPAQPPQEHGPDGSGPYRITKYSEQGYAVEVFIPRSAFKVPVFAPGWFVGFDCAVAQGCQGRQFSGQYWASKDMSPSYNNAENSAVNPSAWGDLLMLGTDPRLILRNTDEGFSECQAVIPGHSCLLTVVDPDRNVSSASEDMVLLSAEIKGGNNDVEVFILKETGANTGVFQGYIDTQPGVGREVQGVLELMPGQEVVFGYVDTANARGERNKVTTLRVPVAFNLMSEAEKHDK